MPPGWVMVPSDGDFYFWNTTTNEVTWDHPSKPKEKEVKVEKKEVFKEEHRILISDLGKVIGAKGINLKIIKESIGAHISVPRKKGEKGEGKGKGKEKGKKGKVKGPDGEVAVYGAGDGSKPIPDDQFVTVSITADNAHAARGGKRVLEVMLGYGKRIEAALEALGVEVKYPKLLDEIKSSAGMKKPGQKSAFKNSSGANDSDSKTANAERCGD